MADANIERPTLPPAEAGKAEPALDLLHLQVERMEAFSRLLTIGVEHIGNDQENTIESLLGLNHKLVLDLQDLLARAELGKLTEASRG